MLGGRPPSRAEVLEQGFGFKPEWWRGRIRPAEWWPPALDALPAAGRAAYSWITRRDIFEIAADAADSVGLARTMVAAYVWGTGWSGWLVGRRARVLADNPPRRILELLQEAMATLRSPGAVEAYGRLHPRGDLHLRRSGLRSSASCCTSPGGTQCPTGCIR